jgi:CRISPR-associated endoribonuclease Cas6
MPSRWALTLPGVNAADVKLEYLHALVCRWFDDSDEAHRASAKPYTVSPAQATPGGITVEIGLLNDNLPDRLRAAAAPGTRIRLGTTWSTITHPPVQVAAIPWTDPTTPTPTAWCLTFLTPTTFRRGNAFTPAPNLTAILGSLRHAWQRFAPAEVPQPTLDLARAPVWLTDIDVRSHLVRVNNLTISGFTGRLRFTCDGTPQQAATVDQLVRLAPFAGVGAYTTRGFGVTRTEPTWPGATPRPAPDPTRSPHLVLG